MPTSLIIIVIGLFIFWGHYLSGVFERKSIPDVLGLMLIGILLGPVSHLVDASSFGTFGSLFSNLVLIFILFESGTDLKISEIKDSFRESAGITTLGFFTTWITTTLLCKFIFGLPLSTCLFIGSTLGGTSSAVVVGLVKKVPVHSKTATTLIIESAETDVFTLAIPLSILGIMLTGNLQTSVVISSFISSLTNALVIGIGGAFLWSFIVNKFPTLKATKFSTPAFLFILYGIAEYLNFSGPLTALSFGIAIGNLQYFEPKLIERMIPNQNIILPEAEKSFFSELVFLLRTFFFVFIGVSIQISRVDWLLWGAVITLALFIVRIIVVKVIAVKNTPLLDKSIMSIMIPKGLGAAVIATLPLQQGHPDGGIIQSVCFSIILFSTLYCVGLFFMASTGISLPLYAQIFGKDKPLAEPENIRIDITTNAFDTPRLHLVRLALHDHEFIRKLVNTEGWIRFIGERNVHSEEDARQYIQKIMAQDTVKYWVARSKSDDTAVGVVTLIQRDYLNSPDIGFAFLPEHTGQGYAFEAASELLLLLRQQSEYHTLLATTIPENTASIALLAKLGFQQDGEIEADGERLLVYKNTIAP